MVWVHESIRRLHLLLPAVFFPVLGAPLPVNLVEASISDVLDMLGQALHALPYKSASIFSVSDTAANPSRRSPTTAFEHASAEYSTIHLSRPLNDQLYPRAQFLHHYTLYFYNTVFLLVKKPRHLKP